MPHYLNLGKLRAIDAFLMGVGSMWSISPAVSAPAHFFITNSSDEDAIASDWQAVGSDLANAMQYDHIVPR